MSQLIESIEDKFALLEADGKDIVLTVKRDKDLTYRGKTIQQYVLKNARKTEDKISGPNDDGYWEVGRGGIVSEWKTLERAIERVRSSAEDRMNAFGGSVTVKILKKY